MNEIIIPEDKFIILGGSSRGYAKKAPIGDLWYKVTAGAFNAHAEVVASRLAAHTNLSGFVSYEMCLVNGEYATVSNKEQLELMYSVSDARLTLKPFDTEALTKDVWQDKHQIGKKEITKYLKGVSC